jgi:hypothetical protein
MNDQTVTIENAGDSWKSLYRIGAVAALVAVILFRRNLSAEFSILLNMGLVKSWPQTWPVGAGEWFAVFQDTPFIGLTMFNFFDLINYTLVGLIFLAVYAALRQANRTWMTIAIAFSFTGIASFYASNQAFALLSLSGKYAAATTEAQRATFLAAGEALLASTNYGSGFYLGLLLVVLAGLVISVVMLHSDVFSKATASMGIAANVLMLGYFVVLPIAPDWIFLPPTLSAPFRVIWYVLIARRLLQLVRVP